MFGAVPVSHRYGNPPVFNSHLQLPKLACNQRTGLRKQSDKKGKMNLTIRPATPSDAPTLATINIAAFTNKPFLASAFPTVSPAAAHALKSARWTQKLATPNTHIWTAVDQDSGAIVGCARWSFPADATDKAAESAASAASGAEMESPWGSGALPLPEGTNRAVYDGFFGTLKEKAAEYVRDEDIVLDFIATSPESQGKGVARALLTWGIEEADKVQRRIYLEATTEGFPVYARLLVKMDVQILPLSKRDIPQAVECIQTVFADDPFFTYMFDPETYNIARNAASLSAHFRHGLAIRAPIYIAKDTASNRVVGICWWHPPEPTSSSPPFTHQAQDALLSIRQFLFNIRYRGRGGLRLNRYRQWKALQAKKHDRIWTDERGYYFCNVIAVRAEMRGLGLGRRLVEVVTERADEEGMPCYLESSKGMPNLAIYQKLGFQGVGEIECVDENGKDGCTLYCMIRQPTKSENDN
ncbi:uncharacterized protein DSM5745_04805 [Aspergillus mulundensis]|uniref:N-acetyltransferase domain-containing protein n=1 Tax=Aspergillus mulundensis TaxID=1810919 RepID=A0A3D8S4Q0_9EURO|nr:Uncharacterized protein DSM5745_04805 [Aspergillus mulundensis]RDW81248.1 Uncharacterized protein DSM5745_04805 [Aspergillus mulundensis]